jgi:6-phosphogluconolactonase (cycloisomerase 2 family)
MFQPSASIYVMAGGRTPADGKRLGEQMSKKISACLALLSFLALSVFLVSCGSSSSRPAGVLYFLSQGENNVGEFAIDLSSGQLSLLHATATTCPTEPCGSPSSILLDPTGKVAYVLNTGTNDIMSYTVNNDGSLSAPTPTALPGSNSVAMARDAAGTFLIVVSQGTISAQLCSKAPPGQGCGEPPAVTVFTTASGSPALTQAGGPVVLSFVPTSVTTSITGTFNDPNPPGGTVSGTLVHITGDQDLVGTNDNTVNEFAVQSSGTLTGPLIGSPYTTGSVPGAVIATQLAPVGGVPALFVYVANSGNGSGGNSISVFQVCTAPSASCTSDDVSNARMIAVAGETSVGLNPVAITADPTNNFLYVVNHGSNTVSGFRINQTTGTLSALSPSSVSTGSGPVAISMHSSGKFLYVSNNASSNVSGFNVSTTNGALSNATNVTTPAQPAGLVAR